MIIHSKISPLAIVAMTFVTSVFTVTDIHATSNNPVTVFKQGDYGSKYYRIPAIVTACDGSLVAVADKRIESNGDLPSLIDVVSRRSTDGGATWSDYVTVAAHDSIGGCGDAALVTDKMTGDIIAIFSHGNGLWQKTPAHISVARSKDNGQTWGPMNDISSQIISTDLADSQPIKCNSAFATSGRALQLSDGRLMFALVTRIEGNPCFSVYAVYSDDGGYSWKSSSVPAVSDGDESKIVELNDGTLIMSVRNRYQQDNYDNKRIFSYSKDRGETWSDMQSVSDINDPACNGDIISYRYGDSNLLLHSLPTKLNQREDVGIYISDDNGNSFKRFIPVVTGPSAYSSMTILPDGNIGILTEESDGYEGIYDIIFRVIDKNKLIK